MKRYVVFWCVCVLVCFAMQAQPQRGVKGGYDVSEFPKVTFVWNSPNPDIIESDRFFLTENDTPIVPTIQVLTDNSNDILKKSILVLWEDMPSHNSQSNFVRTIIERFFSEVKSNNKDYFNIAVFNRQHDSQPKVLTPLLDCFSSNAEQLCNAVRGYTNSNEYYSSFPMQSDLYLAINEGLDILKKEPAERSGVLVVITAGLNVKAAGASTEMETVRQNAIRAGIPIYVVKYPISGNTPEVNSLAESTFGLSSSTIDPDEAYSNLINIYNQFDSRLKGRDYQFTFTSNSKRDGKVHPLRLTVDKVARPVPPYKAPKPTFGMWVASHILLVIILVVILSGIVVASFLLIKNSKKKRQQQDEALRMQIEQHQEDMLQAQHGFDATIENIRREQEAKELEKQQKLEAEEKERERDRLTGLMQTKNLYPRLKCQMGNDGFNYTIRKIHITLGRNADNDVPFTESNDNFNNMTVSGHHADIVFNGTSFELVNVSKTYTQGIVVNGQLCQRWTLRSGDIICLGEAIITFYL